MSHIVSLANTFAASWADTLLRACWQGGLGIALVWLLCRLWPAMPANPRCWLWRLAYLKLLLGLIWLPPLALPLLPVSKLPAAPPVAQAAVPPVQAFPDDAPLMATEPAPSFAALSVSAAASLPPPAAAPLPPPRPTLPTVQTWLLAAWLLGVLSSLGRIGSAWRRACALSRTSRPLADEALQTDAADLSRRLGLRRVPPLHVADGLASPLLLGLGRPAVLLPAFVVSGSPRPELRLMLAHEMAHLARRDLWWNALPLLARHLFFFHPLVWLAGHEWSLSQEIACDALAVETTGTPPSAYARMLLGIATRRRMSAASLFPTLAVAAPRHTLRRRLHAMQHIGTASRPRLILAAALTALLAIGGLLPWHVVAQSGAAVSTPPAVAQGDAAQGDAPWQEQEQKRQADTTVKNAQLDVQLAEVQNHLPATQSKTALAYVHWINADYAANQLAVQLSEQQRADYVASHPNSLTNAQTALIQKVILDKLNHRRISKDVRAKLAAIPVKQRDRVEWLRYCDLNITFARMRAFEQKRVSVYQLRTEYGGTKQRRAGSLPTQSQSRGATTRASLMPYTSTASSPVPAVGASPLLRVAQFVRRGAQVIQQNNFTSASVQISPVMAEALDKEIAQLEKQRANAQNAHPNGGTAEGAVIAFLKARRDGAAWAQASITSRQFSRGLTGEKIENLLRTEQEAQQNAAVAEKYVFLLAVKLTAQENLRRLTLLQNQQPKRMKKNMAPYTSPLPSSYKATLFSFSPRGHSIRMFTQDATGQHLILDKFSDGKVTESPPVLITKGSKVDFIEYDNGKLVKPISYKGGRQVSSRQRSYKMLLDRLRRP